jgi:hypothetical protein
LGNDIIFRISVWEKLTCNTENKIWGGTICNVATHNPE